MSQSNETNEDEKEQSICAGTYTYGADKETAIAEGESKEVDCETIETRNKNNANMSIRQIQSEIVRKCELKYEKDFALKLALAFGAVITKEGFDEIELICDDLENESDSVILDSIWTDLKNHLCADTDITHIKREVCKDLQNIVMNAHYNSDDLNNFYIKNFTFVLTQKDVNKATELAQALAPQIFGNATNEIAEQKVMSANRAEDKSLCIAKAVDYKNGFPITKCLLDSFSRDRLLGHKALFDNFGGTVDEYPFESDKYSTGYNATTWWLRDSSFCRYIQYKNAKMALPLMTAVQALQKRVLPHFNFNPYLAPVIHDNLNDFAQYIFASWSLAHQLASTMDYFAEPAQSTQIDIWIIPQCAKPTKFNPIMSLKELLFDDCQSETEGSNNESNNLLSMFDFHFGNDDHSSNKCNELGKASFMNKVKQPLWDLEQHLQNCDYVHKEDYWWQYADVGLDTIQNQFQQMLNVASDGKVGGKRWIFIIDRRNAENLDHQNMSLKHPNYYKSQTKDLAHKIYLIVRNCNITGYQKLKLMPEIYWCRSKQFLLPNGTKGNASAEPIGVTDSLNGYKFVVSYHLKGNNSSGAYWYSDAGAIKFELQDMRWLFGRFFAKIEKEPQILNDENMILLRQFIKEKPLTDDEFQNFWKQSHSMVLV